ncbi:helix-turn-helix transcriptional regulator [Umezawaea sp.]|uniref:helix-turn-helix transcriptional regulator n=1 Tax=Umezawaea sp. TaxID=1955258 RepID=UPI0039C9937B
MSGTRSRGDCVVPPITDLLPMCRRSRGLTQCDLAARLSEASGNDSVSREEVSRWERGKRIPGPYWRSWLSQALDLPRDDVERWAAQVRSSRRKSRNST